MESFEKLRSVVALANGKVTLILSDVYRWGNTVVSPLVKL